MNTATRTRLYHLNIIAVLVLVALVLSACAAVQQSVMGAGVSRAHLNVGSVFEQ